MIAAGTGHRPNKLGGYSHDAFWRLVEVAMYSVSCLHDIEYIISGMALGWDQALAQACVELGVPFVASVPFLGQESSWPAESQELYRRLMLKAKDVHIVTDGGYAPWKMQTRNEWMVDRIQGEPGVLLAMWDGTEGGTKNCIDYALKHGFINDVPFLIAPYDKVVWNVYDMWSNPDAYRFIGDPNA